jgi:hypothetical protein
MRLDRLDAEVKEMLVAFSFAYEANHVTLARRQQYWGIVRQTSYDKIAKQYLLPLIACRK